MIKVIFWYIVLIGSMVLYLANLSGCVMNVSDPESQPEKETYLVEYSWAVHGYVNVQYCTENGLQTEFGISSHWSHEFYAHDGDSLCFVVQRTGAETAKMKATIKVDSLVWEMKSSRDMVKLGGVLDIAEHKENNKGLYFEN